MHPRRLLLLPSPNTGLGLKLLILIGAEMIAVPPHQASAALLLADVAAGVCSAWAALLRYGTYGGIRLINVPNRNKTNGNFFRLYSTLININALLY